MNILETIYTAFSTVFANKMRTFLTSLGIIIGISAVIVITSLGEGFKNTIDKTFEILNSTGIQISGNYFSENYSDAKLNRDDILNLKQDKNIRYISGYSASQASLTLKNPQDEEVFNIFGCDPDFSYIQKNFFDIKYGRTFTEKDNDFNYKVVIIDENTAFSVFGRKDVVGEYVNLYIDGKDYAFEVIGVTKVAKNSFIPSLLIIPLNTFLEIYNKKDFDMIYIDLYNLDNVTVLQKQFLRILSANHNVSEDSYMSVANFEQVNTIKSVTNTFTLFIVFVALISLFVGGIGVMNIMLVTVTERTREIGIRKSLGATEFNIKLQFMIESIILCFIGGFLGIAFGYIGSQVLGNVLQKIVENATGLETSPPVLSIPIAISSMIASTIVGIIFGVYPASKAAKLDPIEALRYE